MIKFTPLLLLICIYPFITGIGVTDWWHSPESESIPFDATGTELTSEQVGPAIRELANTVDVSASPGFTWGKSGNVSSGAYLLNDTVPSNIAGRIVPVDGDIVEGFAACENTTTGALTVYKRVGATFTTLVTITFTAERYKIQSFSTGNAVLKGDELAVKVSSGSFKNPVFGLVIKGAL